MAKPESKQEPRVPLRKHQPNRSGIETTQEAAGDESENDFDKMSLGNPRKRRMSYKDDCDTQLTMATEEVFKNMPAQKKNQLPHDDFVKNFNSKQRATCYRGQKEAAAFNKTSDSSKDSTFDHLLQSIPRTTVEKKRASPEVSKVMAKEPMLFDEFDFELQDDPNSSKKTKQPKVSKAQNRPQMGNKLNLKLEKSVPGKEASAGYKNIIFFFHQ